MTPPSHSSDSPRVLGLFPHPRHTGQVVVAADGVVPGSASTTDSLRGATETQQVAMVDRLVANAILRFGPTAVAIVRARGSVRAAQLAARVAAYIADRARAAGMDVHVLDEDQLRELFREPRATGPDRLGQALTRVFLPELAARVPSWRLGHEDIRRRLRPIWKAAAAALVALAVQDPTAVASLAHDSVPPAFEAHLDARRAAGPPHVV